MHGQGRLGLLALALVASCTPDAPTDRSAKTRAALDAPLAEALCEVPVDDLGVLAAETDYLPQVLACENNGADFEALKAQAVAARSVVYWTVGTHGSICNGQGCQAYTCTNEVEPIHQQAVDATSGRYLAYNGNVTYAFYVNGDPDTAPPTCVGDPAAPNETWVTYNEGLSGTDVQQTPLGFEHDPADGAYGQNRGCMGQWGARCLEALGYDHGAILRAYYGDDIQILKAEGPCVLDDPMGEGGSGGAGTTTTGS
ncbi:MAG: SpoIID/LytB domain-containing protein, partial [Polyangiaceae bacterium]